MEKKKGFEMLRSILRNEKLCFKPAVVFSFVN